MTSIHATTKNELSFNENIATESAVVTIIALDITNNRVILLECFIITDMMSPFMAWVPIITQVITE